MKKGQELTKCYSGLRFYHQNFPKKQVKSHSHSDAHLFIPIKGDIWLKVNEKKIKVSPGNMLFIDANIIHSFESSDLQGERIIVQFKSDFKPEEYLLLRSSSLLNEIIFYLILLENEQAASSGLKFFKTLLNELLEKNQYFDLSQVESRIKDERTTNAFRYMQENLDASLSEIADQVGTSGKTLTRLYLKELGKNPKEIQTILRISKAQNLLKTTRKSVTEVAYEVGYNSLSQFISNYRTHTGELPSHR